MHSKHIITTLLYLYIGIFTPLCAQQTVFNVPSADITEKDKIYFLEEAQFRPWNPDMSFVSTSFGAYGIGHNTEIDMTLFNVGAPTTDAISLGTGLKSSIPIFKNKFPKREYKFTAGSQILISLQGQGVGNWTFAHLSGRLPKANTRLTCGLSYGTKQAFGEDNLSFIAAIEQPVTKKLNIIADWYSGTEHFAGYLISGFSYSLPKNSTVYLGYQIPNSSQVGPSGFVVQFAKIR